MSPTPRPIDPRGPRANQSVLAVGLVIGFVANWWLIAPIFAAVLAIGAFAGPRFAPVPVAYRTLLAPRIGPPGELEDPRPPQFAARVGVGFLVGATASFALGAATLGWALVLVVAALAGLAAVTGLCVGCEIYVVAARRRGVRLVES